MMLSSHGSTFRLLLHSAVRTQSWSMERGQLTQPHGLGFGLGPALPSCRFCGHGMLMFQLSARNVRLQNPKVSVQCLSLNSRACSLWGLSTFWMRSFSVRAFWAECQAKLHTLNLGYCPPLVTVHTRGPIKGYT